MDSGQSCLCKQIHKDTVKNDTLIGIYCNCNMYKIYPYNIIHILSGGKRVKPNRPEQNRIKLNSAEQSVQAISK